MTALTSRRVTLPQQTRLAPIGSIDAKARTADLIWSTGAAVRRWSWERGAEFWETLSLDPAHVRMDRLRSGAPLLNTHNAFGLEGVIGVVESADVSGGEGRATVRFSDREEVAPIFRDVQNKIIRNVSVGYVVHRLQDTGETRDGLAVFRAIDWEPMELSLVPIGADPAAGVRSETARRYPCVILTKDRTMNDETDIESAGETGAGAELPADLQPATPTLAERRRIRGIADLVRRHGLDPADEARWIDAGTSLATVRKAVLERLVERSEAMPARSGHLFIDSYSNAPAGPRDLMVEGLAARMRGVPPSEAARPYANLRMVELAREALKLRGVRVSTLTPESVLNRSFQSGSDFPGIVADAANKVLLQFYAGAAGGIKQIARKATIEDFRTKYSVRLSEAAGLLKVLPSGEIQRGAFSDSKAGYALSTWSRIYGINRQTIVNDDVGAFADIVRAMGLAASEVESGELATLFTSNAATYDAVACFHASHSNLAGSGAVISVATLGAAAAAMRLQKGIGGVLPLGLTPRFLIVPAALEAIALQFVSAIAPAQASNVNPFAQKLEVVADPRLDASSATAWYLASDGQMVPTVEYSYLSGEEGPQTQTRDSWDIDGMEFKVTLDFGCAILDWRGLYKNPGA